MDFRAKLIICRESAYPKDWDYVRFRSNVDKAVVLLLMTWLTSVALWLLSNGAVRVGLPPTMAELAKAPAKALMPSFGDGREDQRRVEVLTQEITDLLKNWRRDYSDSLPVALLRTPMLRKMCRGLLPLTFRTSQWNFTKKVNILDSGCRKRFMLALGMAVVFLDFLRLLRGSRWD